VTEPEQLEDVDVVRPDGSVDYASDRVAARRSVIGRYCSLPSWVDPIVPSGMVSCPTCHGEGKLRASPLPVPRPPPVVWRFFRILAGDLVRLFWDPEGNRKRYGDSGSGWNRNFLEFLPLYLIISMILSMGCFVVWHETEVRPLGWLSYAFTAPVAVAVVFWSWLLLRYVGRCLARWLGSVLERARKG
jgi:hypothetical protein